MEELATTSQNFAGTALAMKYEAGRFQVGVRVAGAGRVQDHDSHTSFSGSEDGLTRTRGAGVLARV